MQRENETKKDSEAVMGRGMFVFVGQTPSYRLKFLRPQCRVFYMGYVWLMSIFFFGVVQWQFVPYEDVVPCLSNTILSKERSSNQNHLKRQLTWYPSRINLFKKNERPNQSETRITWSFRQPAIYSCRHHKPSRAIPDQ